MALEKQDLQEIKKIVNGAIERSEATMSGKIGIAIKKSEATMSDKIDGAIEKSEATMSDKIEYFIEKSEIKMEKKIESIVKASEERINQNIKQEVTDLSIINRAAFMKTDQLEYRLQIVERKLGIKT